MTPSSPRTVAQVTDDVVALSERLHLVGLELRRVQSAPPAPAPQVAAPRPAAPQVAPRPVAPGPPPWVRQGPVPQSPPLQGPPLQGPVLQGPVPQGPPPRGPVLQGAPRPPVPPRPPVAPREPWWQREGVLSRVLAVAGSAVTLLGVVMLLVLAVQAGYLGPVPRVVGGAVLAAALVGLALRVRGRAGGEVGAVALAGTGFAGLYLDVVAATAGYGWLPVPVGLALTLAVVAAGVLLADRWRSEVLAVIVVAGGAVLCPVVTQEVGLLTTGFLLVLQAAALPSALRRGWRLLPVVAAVPPVLSALLATAAAADGDRPGAAILGAALVTALALAAAVATQKVRPADVAATVGLLTGVVPTLVVALVVDRWVGVAVAAGLAVVLGLLAGTVRWLVRPVRLSLLAVLALAVLQASLLAGGAAAAPALLLGEALVLLAVAHQLRSRVVLLGAAAFAVIGGLAAVAQAPTGALVSARAAERALDWPVVAALALLAAVAVALAAEVRFSQQVRDLRPVWIVAGLVALHGLTGTLVGIGVRVLGRDGFVLGHTVATVSWTVLALALLAVGLRRGAMAVTARIGGMLLAAAAVAKLLLFDLAALDGVFRVVAFLVVGLLLLTAGTRYARMLGTAAQAHPGAPHGPAAQGWAPQGQAPQGPVQQGPPPQGPPRR